MGNSYFTDNIAENHVTFKNHNGSTALERSVIDYWGGGGRKHVFSGSKPLP